MSLEGSIKEFGLADIFQLISLQKKSGVLAIHQNEISATINFFRGQIVYAVSSKREEEGKIGRLLITASKLTEKEIGEALSIQNKTGDKIGQVLITSGFISKEELKEALEIQIKDVVFQILRWKEGWYRFDIQDTDSDKEHHVSVQTDFVLMEGIRMLDEWPYIESIIPSDGIIFSQNYKSDESQTLFSSLSTNELLVFNLINGLRDIKEIVGMTQFSEFDVYKIFATLKVSGLISENTSSGSLGKVAGPVVAAGNEKKILWTLLQIAILTSIISFVLILVPIREMAGISDILSTSNILKDRGTKEELASLHKAISYYRLINGAIPDSLEVLYNEQYLKKGLLTDPWGNPFVYEKSNPTIPGYRLYSTGPDRTISTEDDIF